MNSYEEFWNTLPKIQLHFHCEVCQRRYMKGWFQVSPTLCLFCRSYREVEYLSRSDLMRDIEWAFIQSGDEEKGRFYSDYLNQIHRWSDAMGVPYTQEDQRQEEAIYRALMD
jgi:hypothetical protein